MEGWERNEEEGGGIEGKGGGRKEVSGRGVTGKAEEGQEGKEK